MSTPQRRDSDIEADEVERFFGTLPKVIKELKRGRWQNRILAAGAVALALWLSSSDDSQREALEESQRMDRVRAEHICEDLTDNARKFNKLIDTIVLRTKQSPSITDAQRRQALALYEASRQTLPVCVPPMEK